MFSLSSVKCINFFKGCITILNKFFETMTEHVF